MLKFKVDENMPSDAAALIRAAGHDVATVVEQQLGGRADYAIAEICRQEDRAFVALDLDIAYIQAYPPANFAGILVLRLSRLDLPQILSALQRILPTLENEPLASKLWIVDETRVRIRG